VPRLSATPGTFRRPAPGLGEHTSEVLEEVGVSPEAWIQSTVTTALK